jgi:hypothetical protein
MKKKHWIYLLGALGIGMMIFSQILRRGMPDAEVAITNLASSFMLMGGGLSIVVAIVMFLKNDEYDQW